MNLEIHCDNFGRPLRGLRSSLGRRDSISRLLLLMCYLLRQKTVKFRLVGSHLWQDRLQLIQTAKVMVGGRTIKKR